MGDRPPKQKKPRPARLALLALLAAALLAGGAALTAGLCARSLSARLDDVDAILADYRQADFRGAALAEDGSVIVRLEKADIYWFASEYGLMDRFRSALAAGESGLEITGYGFRIQDGAVSVVLSGRAGGVLPAAYRAVLSVESEGTVLRFRVQKVTLGARLTLPVRYWPELLPKEGFSFDFRYAGISDSIRRVYLDGNALVLEADGLLQALPDILRTDTALLDALRTYGAGGQDRRGMLAFLAALDTDRVPLAEAEALALSSGNAQEALTDLFACCTADSLETAVRGCGRFTREFAASLMRQDAAARRAELEKTAAGEQGRYEKLLTAVREMYKAGKLRIGESGFRNAVTGEVFDPSALTAGLSVTSTDSRLVFLYSDAAEAAGIRTADMPPVGRVPRSGDAALQGMDPERVYDLGFLMTTEGGRQVLLYYRQNGTLVLRELTEAAYTDLLLSARNPVVREDEPDASAAGQTPAWQGAEQ